MLARAALLLLSSALCVVSGVAPAAATTYEIFLDVETEQDLYDALSAHQIDGDTFERLRDLLARGVDLDVASRQELYELPNLSLSDVDAILAHRGAYRLGDGRSLVTSGVLDELSYQAIAPFLLVRGGGGKAGFSDLSGWAQVQLRASPEDRGMVPVGVRLRAFGFGKWSAGVALGVTRLRLDDIGYDPNQQALTAAAPALRLAMPKLYLRREDGRSALLLGSYRAGFGQRLVFDDTGAEQPTGFVFDDQLLMSGGLTKACKLSTGEEGEMSPCAGGEATRYATPDLRWRDGLFGAAVSLKQLTLGERHVALHAWASYAARGVYQYELVDRERCPDPRLDDASCDALDVVQSSDEPSAPPSRHAYQTLPSIFSEALAGAHASYGSGRRDHLGITGYFARTEDLVSGIALGGQASSRIPIGQRFGAVGAEGVTSFGNFELGAEVARSFDELPRAAGLSSGGGLGAVVRFAWSREREDLESEPGSESGSESESESESEAEPASAYSPVTGSSFELLARYYQPTFINPYARPVAAADQLEGQRARDEAGVRARASWSQPRFALRASLDVWSQATLLTPKLASELRAEGQVSQRLRVGAAASFDLACDSAELASTDDASSLSCGNHTFSSRLRTALQLTPSFQLTAQAQHDLLDDHQRLTFWLLARRHSLSGLHARVHLRYRDDDASRTLASSSELRFALGEASHLALHLEAQLQLQPQPEAASSSTGLPNPILSLGATYDVAL